MIFCGFGRSMNWKLKTEKFTCIRCRLAFYLLLWPTFSLAFSYILCVQRFLSPAFTIQCHARHCFCRIFCWKLPNCSQARRPTRRENKRRSCSSKDQPDRFCGINRLVPRVCPAPPCLRQCSSNIQVCNVALRLRNPNSNSDSKTIVKSNCNCWPSTPRSSLHSCIIYVCMWGPDRAHRALWTGRADNNCY